MVNPAHVFFDKLTEQVSKNFNITDKLAQLLHDQFISSELFVLAALESKGNLGQLLRKAGCEKNAVEQAIDALRGGQKVDDPKAEEQRKAPEK